MLYLTEPGTNITSAGAIFTRRKHFQLTAILIQNNIITKRDYYHWRQKVTT